MDPRVREHAQLIADAVDLAAGDEFLIKSEPPADDLVTALYEVAGERGAHPLAIRTNRSGRAIRAYLNAADESGVEFETPAHQRALVEAADCHAIIRAHENVTELGDVDPDVNSAYEKAHGPILEERLGDRWTLTQYPTPANAQLAEMSSEAYENFVYDAILKDWDEQAEFQAQLVEILDPAEESFPYRGRTIFESVGGTMVHETLKASELRDRYLERLAARKDDLRHLCATTGWLYGTHHTSDSAQSALLWLYNAFDGGHGR